MILRRLRPPYRLRRIWKGVKAITEGPQSSKAASPEEIRPLKNPPEEPGATKETKVAVAAEGVLPSPQSAPFQRTSKAAASDLKTPEKKDEEGQHGVGSVEKSVAPQSDPKMSEPPHMSTPMTPLFDENQTKNCMHKHHGYIHNMSLKLPCL